MRSAHRRRDNVIGARDDADNIKASASKTHQKAEDMTAPTILAVPMKSPLIKRRHPDMTVPARLSRSCICTIASHTLSRAELAATGLSMAAE